MYDLIVIGGGPAGLTASIFAKRRKLNLLLISKEIGGQAAKAPLISNYPALEEVSGAKFVERLFKQVMKENVEMILEEVVGVDEGDSGFVVKTHEGKTFECKALIIACGKTPRSLNVKGEKELIGKGVSYCASCDGPLYKDKIVAVVGGGNSALDATLYLSKLCKKVFLIHRRDCFRAFEKEVEEVKKRNNIELLLNSVVEEIKGEKRVEGVVIKNVDTNEIKEIKIDGIFIEIGSELRTEFLKHLVKRDSSGQIVINEVCQTFYPESEEIRPGVFAAGDVTNVPFKQIVIAAGQGAIAALQAYDYLQNLKGGGSGSRKAC